MVSKLSVCPLSENEIWLESSRKPVAESARRSDHNQATGTIVVVGSLLITNAQSAKLTNLGESRLRLVKISTEQLNREPDSSSITDQMLLATEFGSVGWGGAV
jgi:hypothetical protein